MSAMVHSPNWYWDRLGYSVERGPRKTRTIRRPDLSVVEILPSNDRHDAEIEAAMVEMSKLGVANAGHAAA